MKEIFTSCSCGCSVLGVIKYDSNEYAIEYLKSSFDTEQMSIISKIAKRIKNAFYTLIGKEYYLFDIVLTKEEFEDFKSQINGL
jgi:hypothetical protein